MVLTYLSCTGIYVTDGLHFRSDYRTVLTLYCAEQKKRRGLLENEFIEITFPKCYETKSKMKISNKCISNMNSKKIIVTVIGSFENLYVGQEKGMEIT